MGAKLSMERRQFLTGAAAMMTAAAAGAQGNDYKSPALVSAEPGAPLWPARERFPLWPGRAPGAPSRLPTPAWRMFREPHYAQLWIKGIAVPEVSVFRPALSDGSALLVIPGGGYEFLAIQNEGLHVAERYNAEGTTVFILSYRLPGEGWANRSTVPLSDAQRAMRLIRARAAEFRIDPSRLGIIGFSAGGNLAAQLTAQFDERVYSPVDAADQQSARPAFSGLIYPVATLDRKITHMGSFQKLLGPNPTEALIAARSPERHVGPNTPPSFVVHAFDDGAVPVANSLRWIEAAQAAKVSVEAHLFAEGGHGFGLRLPKELPGSRWPDLFATWMRKHGG